MPGNRPQRGDIYHIKFDAIGPHYAIVISANALNHNTDSVVIAILTSQRVDKIYPHEFLLPKGILPHDSKVKCNSIASWPQEELNEKSFAASIEPQEIQGLDIALMKALDLWY